MNSEPECYGRLFPSVVEMVHNRPVAGKVFGYEVDYSGQVAQRRSVTLNHDAWQECLNCSHLDGCYRVSAGRLLMELAVRAAPQTQYGG